MRKRTIASLILAGASAFAADSPVRGPVLGFVLDGRSQAIRPIVGMPGSSWLGPALSLPFPIARATFASSGELALAVAAGEQRSVFLLRGLQAIPLPEAVPDPEWLVFNETNSAAVLYSAARRQIQLVSGLLDSPRTDSARDLPGLSGEITSLALDADGSCVLAGVRDSDAGAVFSWCFVSGEEPRPRFLSGFPMPAQIVYVNGGKDAAVADSILNQVFLIREVQGRAEVSLVATEKDGVFTPVGMQLAANHRELVVANADGSVTVHALDASSASQRFPLPLTPSRLQKLSGGEAFLLNEIGRGPLLLLDELEGRRVLFVPVD